MRFAIFALAALAATGCMSRSTSSGSGSGTGQVSPANTKLDISVSIGGSEAPTKTWTLECPDGGTLPNPERACAKLAVLDDPFAPVPKDKACTQVFGGPEEAVVHRNVPRRARQRPLQQGQRLRDRALEQRRVPLPDLLT